MKRDLILIIGTLLLIGILFFVQVIFEFPLSVAIMICIFVLAAVFWVAEPIPGYATSILVIFLEIIFFANPIGIPGFVFPQNKNTACCSLSFFFGGFFDYTVLGRFCIGKSLRKDGFGSFFCQSNHS